MEYFYYFSAVYILSQLRNAWLLYFDKEDAKQTLKDVFPDDTLTKETVQQSFSKSMDKLRKGIPDMLLSLSCIGWIIAGIAYTPESPMFVLLLIVTATIYIVAVIYSGYYIARNKNRIIGKMKSDGIKSMAEQTVNEIPDTRQLLLIDKFLKILIVIYILYVHYFSLIA